MKKWMLISALSPLLLLSGCSTAGPFVTNVSSDGSGGLTIEKCMVHYNPLGFVNNSDCTNTTVRVTKSQ